MRIYISSTYSDLKEYRAQIRLALRRMGHEDIAMEYYTATEEKPLDKCLADVASCDLYIGIFAWRYGYIPEGGEQSITELEYRQAQKKDKPRYIFILHPDAAWPASSMEFGKLDHMTALRDELQRNHIVAYFSTPEELTTQVVQALSTLEESVTQTPEKTQAIGFLESYRQSILVRHQFLIPPNFGGERRRIPINDLYIVPSFRLKDHKGEFSISEMLSKTRHTVVLAPPGGGKSSLTIKLCYDLASRALILPLDPAPQVPVLVILREYGAEKKSSHCSLLDFLVSKATSDYQTKPPPQAFEYLLQQGYLLVIFDGLDELLDASYRQAIAEDIELFCSQYPTVPVIVTSREVGYDEAPLDKQKFDTWLMTGFNESQIAEYVQKWFKAITDADADTPIASQFLEELHDIHFEIKSNPLLLALLCSIYRGERTIPNNKPDIYEKCTVLLFEKRDKERDIRVSLPFEAHIRPLLMYLADWIYGNEKRESGVVEKDLVKQATNYLLERRYADADEAARAADQFVQFCVGRAWVFSDTGITAHGEPIYQFTHRTFLEYFAAGYLLRTHRTPSDLIETLLPYLATQERTVVAQLAFQQMARETEGAADELFSTLIAKARTSEEHVRATILLFCASCLEFIVPKPTIIHELIESCIEFSIEIAGNYLKELLTEASMDEIFLDHAFYEDHHFIYDFLSSVSNCTQDNQDAVADALRTTLVHRIQSDHDDLAMLATEIALNLDSAILTFREEDKTQKSRRQKSYLGQITQSILVECLEDIKLRICPKYVLPAIEVFYERLATLSDLIAWHGTSCLFQEYHHILFFHQYIAEIAPSLLSDWCKDSDAEQRTDYFDLISELGALLLAAPLPWITFSELEDRWTMGQCFPDENTQLSSQFLFGAFTILAFLQERWYERGYTNSYVHADDLHKLLPGYLDWVFIARAGQEEVEDVLIEAQLMKCGFSPEQRAFILDWVSGDSDVTQ